jgi:hypothetical protein
VKTAREEAAINARPARWSSSMQLTQTSAARWEWRSRRQYDFAITRFHDPDRFPSGDHIAVTRYVITGEDM